MTEEKLENSEDSVEKLYHYTSKESFLEIIKNKSLFATDIRFLNDGMESEIVSKILSEILSKNGELKNALQKISPDFSFNLIEFYEKFKGVGVYVISFSEKKDDLNQWRCYASNASGICIEFNIKKFLDCLKINKCQSDIIQPEFDLKRCVYEKKVQIEILQKLLTDFKDKNDTEKNFVKLITELLKCSAYFKDEAFKDETEYRIVVTNVGKKIKKARLGRNAYIPYYEVEIEKKSECKDIECNHPWLGDILIGPNNPLSVIDSDKKFDYILESVRQACFINGIEFCDTTRKLKKSKIPYRG